MALRNIGNGRKSGLYTPTLTAVTNVAAATAPNRLMYSCEGDVVHVTGIINVDPTAAAATTLRISLPFPCDITAGELAGNGAAVASGHGRITPDVTNNDAQLDYTSAGTAAEDIAVDFSYLAT